MGADCPRRCVYTALLGDYEPLNEQPAALRSGMPFICFTDNPRLTSDTWQIRLVRPLFAMDPIRSQREIKLRPHAYLPEFDASMYIDNSVRLREPPEILFERHFPASGLLLLEHSFRATMLEEFLEVVRVGLDEPGRVLLQLNHYLAEFPEILDQHPLWGGLQLRDHRRPEVRALLELWLTHVLRHSRRDQLSVHAALRQTGFAPDILQLDNRDSGFHTWPHTDRRNHEKAMFDPASDLPPMTEHPGRERLSRLLRWAGRWPRLAQLLWRCRHYAIRAAQIIRTGRRYPD